MATFREDAEQWVEEQKNFWVEEYRKGQGPVHPKHNHFVQIIHEDGTTLFFDHAWACCYEGEYLVVFTEHNGEHIFSTGDLLGYAQWENRIDVPAVSRDDVIQREDDDG